MQAIQRINTGEMADVLEKGNRYGKAGKKATWSCFVLGNSLCRYRDLSLLCPGASLSHHKYWQPRWFLCVPDYGSFRSVSTQVCRSNSSFPAWWRCGDCGNSSAQFLGWGIGRYVHPCRLLPDSRYQLPLRHAIPERARSCSGYCQLGTWPRKTTNPPFDSHRCSTRVAGYFKLAGY